MNRFLFRLFICIPLACLLAAPHTHAQPFKKAAAPLRAPKISPVSKSVSPALQRHIAFARKSHFTQRSFIFSEAETRRIQNSLMQGKHLSAQEVRRLLLAHPAKLAAQYKIPALQKNKAMFLTDFSARRITRIRHLPPYPAELFPGDMARGMVLEKPEESLPEIFSQGLLTKRAGIDAWTGKRLIFMVNNTPIALKYARTDTPGVPVIVHIDGFNGEANYMTDSAHDIPASQIIRISALLNIGGKPIWGQLTPAADGFLFHPYKTTLPGRLQSGALRLIYPDEH